MTSEVVTWYVGTGANAIAMCEAPAYDPTCQACQNPDEYDHISLWGGDLHRFPQRRITAFLDAYLAGLE